MRSRTRVPWAMSLVAAALLPGVSGASVPPGLPIPSENYAALHPWGSSGVVDIRHMALGNACVGDDRDTWHANPAALVSLPGYAVEGHYTVSPFESLPDVNRYFVGMGGTIGTNQRFKVVGTIAKAKGTMRVGATPLNLEASEDDVSIEYAWRVNNRLAVGVGTAYLSTQSKFSATGLGTVTELSSRPKVPGGRIGLTYKLSANSSIGATYDNYMERVVQRATALGLADNVNLFHSTAIRVGLALWENENTTLLIDHEDIAIVGAGTKTARRGTMVGLERRLGVVALRMGAYEGKLTGGVGVKTHGWDVGYAFSGKNTLDMPGMGGTTTHAFQVRRSL